MKIYLELEEEEYVKGDIREDIKKIQIRDYLSKSELLGLNNVEIRILVPETFDKLYKRRYSEYIDPGLIQIPRSITDPADIEIIRQNILFIYE